MLGTAVVWRGSISTATRSARAMPLKQLSRHSLIDITLRAEGDLHIDYHHTTEDLGIVLGECLAKALGDRAARLPV